MAEEDQIKPGEAEARRALLRHFLAALAYRTQKAVREAPEDFGDFQAGNLVRTPRELVRHMTSVLGYARTHFRGGTYRPEPLPTFAQEMDRFHAMLADLSQHLEAGDPSSVLTEEQFLQGPFADAMTHAGQLALLRRLHGSPVPPEDFVFADVDPANVGPEQPPPRRPDAEWPEGPEGSRGSSTILTGLLVAALPLLALGACSSGDPDAGPLPGEWPAYGRDAGGSRYSPLSEINADNVGGLSVAWTFSTGDVSHDPGNEVQGECGNCHTGDVKFEATPVVTGGRMFVSTPLNRVVALDPGVGTELWRFDPHVKMDIERSEGFVSRGVSYWAGPEVGGPCAERVLLGTIEGRLHALDAGTGAPCTDFGEDGTVRLDVGVGDVQEGQYGITSPPAIVGDVVVVGSSMGDNRRVDMERGIVRGYDVRSGNLLWSWDPIPRDSSDPMYETWSPEAAAVTGAGNAWAPLSADPERDLVFVPTGSAAPDFYGGQRPGENRYANSVVALRASTGELVWHFQVVHHDVWDYDVPSQPVLTSVTRDGGEVPAVVVGTKQGFLFVLHRETGEPLFPVEERPVPQSTIPGETLSPTQPFPVLPEPLHPFGFSPDEVFGLTEGDRAACRQIVEALDWEGMYTPPSFAGNLMFPGYGGGMNWGGVAIDESRGWAVTNVLRMAFWVRLQERASPDRGNQRGTPYQMFRAMIMGPGGLPCSPPPWSTLVAVDLGSGQKRWEVPLGSVPSLVDAGHPGVDDLGSPALGGPMVTAGGLVFIGAGMDDFLRAYDVETGAELWRGPLPAGGQATPMTYLHGGKQYIAIAAGGHASIGTTRGDYIVAFALPD